MASRAAIGLAYHEYGTHCGVYYDAGEAFKLLHVTSHSELKSTAPDSRYFMDIETGFREHEKIAVSNFCRVVLVKHGGKGFRYSVTRTDAFLPSGDLVVDAPGAGFSCATFVKCIFEAMSLPLIVDSTWPEAGQKDRNWLDNLIAVFVRKYNTPEDHKHFAETDPTSKWCRYKSEEIAAAGWMAPPAAEYRRVKPATKRLLARLHSTFHKLDLATVS